MFSISRKANHLSFYPSLCPGASKSCMTWPWTSSLPFSPSLTLSRLWLPWSPYCSLNLPGLSPHQGLCTVTVSVRNVFILSIADVYSLFFGFLLRDHCLMRPSLTAPFPIAHTGMPLPVVDCVSEEATTIAPSHTLFCSVSLLFL